jgi:hypothetical protein
MIIKNTFFEKALWTRGWEIENIPYPQSALAKDLMLLCVYTTKSQSPLSFKEVVASLRPFSEAGIRKQLKRCLEEGWVRIVDSPSDKRVRHIVAEPRLLELFERYAEIAPKDDIPSYKQLDSMNLT